MKWVEDLKQGPPLRQVWVCAKVKFSHHVSGARNHSCSCVSYCYNILGFHFLGGCPIPAVCTANCKPGLVTKRRRHPTTRCLGQGLLPLGGNRWADAQQCRICTFLESPHDVYSAAGQGSQAHWAWIENTHAGTSHTALAPSCVPPMFRLIRAHSNASAVPYRSG